MLTEFTDVIPRYHPRPARSGKELVPGLPSRTRGKPRWFVNDVLKKTILAE